MTDKWISVKNNNLPDKFENVIAVDRNKKIHFGYLYKVFNKDVFAVTYNGKTNGNITHWQPTPSPP